VPRGPRRSLNALERERPRLDAHACGRPAVELLDDCARLLLVHLKLSAATARRGVRRGHLQRIDGDKRGWAFDNPRGWCPQLRLTTYQWEPVAEPANQCKQHHPRRTTITGNNGVEPRMRATVATVANYARSRWTSSKSKWDQCTERSNKSNVDDVVRSNKPDESRTVNCRRLNLELVTGHDRVVPPPSHDGSRCAATASTCVTALRRETTA
jgi:hypothetical protein